MPASSRSGTPGQSVLTLRIRLEGVDPAVWRRLLVPGSVRLAKLHDVFQAAMRWNDSHLHSFRIGDKVYGTEIDDDPDDELDENDVSVLEAIGGEPRFTYAYDFGDSWEHEVIVEEISTLPIGLKFAVCLDGQNACPPEDCGGSPGYTRMLEAIGHPSHDEHEHYLAWVGGSFDPSKFDLAAVNAALQQIRCLGL